MNYTQDEMVQSVIQVVEALGISENELESIGLVETAEPFFGRGDVVEADFAPFTLGADYFKGLRSYATVEFLPKKATLCVNFGQMCKNPAVANHFMEKYMKYSDSFHIWQIPCEATEDRGLVLCTAVGGETLEEITEEMAKRLSMLGDEMFTNELRPFIHYFI